MVASSTDCNFDWKMASVYLPVHTCDICSRNSREINSISLIMPDEVGDKRNIYLFM